MLTYKLLGYEPTMYILTCDPIPSTWGETDKSTAVMIREQRENKT